MKFPTHIMLQITHNQHRTYRQTIAEYMEIQFTSDGRHDDECTEADFAEILRTDEVWELQWYPKTPIGFCVLYAPTWDRLVELIDAHMGDWSDV